MNGSGLMHSIRAGSNPPNRTRQKQSLMPNTYYVLKNANERLPKYGPKTPTFKFSRIYIEHRAVARQGLASEGRASGKGVCNAFAIWPRETRFA